MAGPHRRKPQGRHRRTPDGSPRPARSLPPATPRPSGGHRRQSPPSFTWRTTGGVLIGAAVLATAAATAQASVLPFGSVPASAAAEAAQGRKGGNGPARNDSSKDESKRSPKTPADGASGSRSQQDDGSGSGGERAQGRPEAGESQQPPEDSRPTAEQAIDMARSQVGITEDRRGRTKFQEWYMGTRRAQETLARDGGSLGGYRAAAWCDMFISWVGEQIGFGHQIGSDAWTVAHARWFERQGRWGTEPKPGAIVFYSWRGGKRISDIVHVGMVVRKINGSTIEAVEGNAENAVKIKRRSAATIVGYGYPDYKS